MISVIPASIILPTRDRPYVLARTLESLRQQSAQPAEIIVVDGSSGQDGKEVVNGHLARTATGCKVVWKPATRIGAAAQRNEGAAASVEPFTLFVDDDVLFEPGCLRNLWDAINKDKTIGGVSAMITNQRYQSPGFTSRAVFTMLHGRCEKSFAGKVIGPAVNLLPEDRADLPEVVPVEWLNMGCTMYRREALPSPPLDTFFNGYSLMEDLALSLRVARRGWKLANVRSARIFHDSQPGPHKSDVAALSAMELRNRHYVMTQVLQRRGLFDYLKLAIFEFFQLASVARQNPRALLGTLRGKILAPFGVMRR
jgi:cellulose synthase/poly-beta-1,6-N-acetylglucosamine synthase-like glycosyltransferase